MNNEKKFRSLIDIEFKYQYFSIEFNIFRIFRRIAVVRSIIFNDDVRDCHVIFEIVLKRIFIKIVVVVVVIVIRFVRFFKLHCQFVYFRSCLISFLFRFRQSFFKSIIAFFKNRALKFKTNDSKLKSFLNNRDVFLVATSCLHEFD